jgi:hypothetical protein
MVRRQMIPTSAEGRVHHYETRLNQSGPLSLILPLKRDSMGVWNSPSRRSLRPYPVQLVANRVAADSPLLHTFVSSLLLKELAIAHHSSVVKYACFRCCPFNSPNSRDLPRAWHKS